MGHVLELKNVSKKLGRKQIIKDLSFTVDEGEVFGFLGPNGAGKTTTIKMIVGLLSADEGEIYIDGIDARKHFEKAMRNVGAIIENPEMYDYLSGLKNLKMYGRMYGHIPKERYQEIVDQVRLGNRIKDKVKKYSLGMKQRLGVAQALIHNPKLLILDEPTNGLDPAGIKELRDNLRTMARENGLAVLVSSHLLSEMELMCDRFGIIDSGVLVDMKAQADLKEEQQEILQMYTLLTDEPEQALAAVRFFLESEGEEHPQDAILAQIPLRRQQVPELIAQLVSKNIRIYGISMNKHSLEDEFFAATAKNSGQLR